MAGSLCEVIQQARAIAAAVSKCAVELPGCVDRKSGRSSIRTEIMEVMKAGLGTWTGVITCRWCWCWWSSRCPEW